MTLDSDISEHDDCLGCFESARLGLFTFCLLRSEAPRQTRQPCFDHIAKFLFYSGRSQYDVCCFIGSACDA